MSVSFFLFISLSFKVFSVFLCTHLCAILLHQERVLLPTVGTYAELIEPKKDFHGFCVYALIMYIYFIVCEQTLVLTLVNITFIQRMQTQCTPTLLLTNTRCLRNWFIHTLMRLDGEFEIGFYSFCISSISFMTSFHIF